jgi:hypothetical protein
MPDNDPDNSSAVPGHKARPLRRPHAPLLRLVVPAVVLAALVLLMVVITLGSPPRNGEQAAAWSTETPAGEKRPEPPGYEKVLDDTRILRRPYFALLRQAREKTARELHEEAEDGFDFGDLVLNPPKYRGRLLRVEGRVIDVRAVILQPDPSEQEGLPAREVESVDLVYQTEIVKMVNGGVTEKYFLHTEDFPCHLSPGDGVRFAGYFYNRYKGKEIELAEGGRAVVVAPLLVGGRVERAEKREYSRELVKVEIRGSPRDRTKISKEDEETIAAAVEAMKSVDGASDLSYFDMAVNPAGERYGYRGCVVRISGEVSRIESLEDEDVPETLKKYRRIVLTLNKDTPFARYAAAYVSPDVGEIREMQVVTLRGIFIKSARMKGGRDRVVDLPLAACGEAESIAWPETGEVDPWLRTLFIGVIIIAAAATCAAALIFYMALRDRRKRAERAKGLRDIMNGGKGKGKG